MSVLAIYLDMLFVLIGFIPGVIGVRLRRFFYSPHFGSVGKSVHIGIGVRFQGMPDIYIGDNVWIDDYSIIIAGKPNLKGRYVHIRDVKFSVDEGKVIIGEGVHIAQYSLIQGHGGVSVGNYCTIGSGSKIYTLSHHYRAIGNSEDILWKYSSMAPKEEQSLVLGPVKVGNACAVTPNCMLLSGAHLDDGSWLLSYSVLSQKIKPMMIASGNPAVEIKERERQ